ncbi:uncharacterized protein EKO05_0007818 [Ascochyta rabiei]|uniref:Uncharacterized protein n=1 Tax=Didymella rabiei TaxID=5454 RepID=A0A162ZWM9_DIDRA|nr:uncharacterized protein EKO05_0007818 [Ascochyta rabiei]KZM20849.1 hypothetical protein ST47_g7997 [Ascochyta rabiei]UPX17466.1 hypothetical protein EKO05_0007818 [Ascochyta rabiei]
MFHRPALILSFLLLALFMPTANAGRHNPPPRNCTECTAKMEKCHETCKAMTEDSCRFYCECNVAESDHFCRDSCGIGGPESACGYF